MDQIRPRYCPPLFTRRRCTDSCKREWTDLHWVVWCLDLDQVKRILAADLGHINAQDDQGWTPLHLACCSKESRLWDLHQIKGRDLGTEVEKTLSDRPGAKSRYPTLAYTKSRLTQTPSNFAEKNIAFLIALDLLQAGANGRVKAKRFCTPLHCAASSGWVDHVDALLYFGALLYIDKECAPVCWATHPGNDCRMVLEYFQKRLGPDSWRRIRDHGHCHGGNLPDYTKPSLGFIEWYTKDLIPNSSRPCLPGSVGAVFMEPVWAELLCSLCKFVRIDKMCSPSGYLHATSLKILRESSIDCPSCRFLFRFVENRSYITAEKDVSQVILRIVSWRDRISTLRLQLSSGCYCSESRSLDFQSCKGLCEIMLMEDIAFDVFSSDYPQEVQYGRVPATNSNLSESIAKRWLRVCEESHLKCRTRSSNDMNHFPTRLIDVIKSHGLGRIRLVLGNELKSGYVALSHRWISGPTPVWVTSKSNIQRRHEGFAMSELPSAICDAILVTRRLGLRYLWVDSLCIIQDSPSDWGAESVKMLDVYGNSTVTIFADCARDDDDNVLKVRDQGNFQKRRGISLPVRSWSGVQIKIQLLQRYSRYHALLPARASELFQDDVATSTLSSRGWIFQEQVISPRRLHFGNHQMYWMCEEAFEAEDGSVLNVPPYFQWLFKKQANYATSEHKDWAALSENYSHRSLSRSEDKLRALSGLAKMFSKRYSDVYLCGCWSKCLKLDLLWVAKPSFERGEEQVLESAMAWSKASGAPTWSWISADGPVEYPYIRASGSSPLGNEIQFEIIQIPQIHHGGRDIFGCLPVSCTALKLRGVVEQAVCLGELQDIELNPNLAPPWYRGSKDFFGHTMILYNSDLDNSQPMGWMITDRLCEQLVRPLELLLLSAWELKGTCPDCHILRSRYRYFIVLDSVEGQPNVVRRVGYGWAYNRESDAQEGHHYEDEDYRKRWRSAPKLLNIV